MGQKLGRAKLSADAASYANLPAAAVEAAWRDFSLNSDGWGLDLAGFQHLCAVIAAALGDGQAGPDVAAGVGDASALALFHLMDTDNNDLVDGLELLSAIGALSTMPGADKLRFLARCFDLGGGGRLSRDELCLLLRTTLAGLCKLYDGGAAPPASAAIDRTVELVFTHTGAGARDAISIEPLCLYLQSDPVAASWLGHFDDVSDTMTTVAAATAAAAADP
ncbi:unnamed protein product, partial [Phaeothamnion confervicola]